MKIYTKTGDNGTTALVGGTRVAKNSERVEAYGTVDELISWIGVLRGYAMPVDTAKQLRAIQECLMTCAALLAADDNAHKKLPTVTGKDVHALELAIDEMQNTLPPLKTFVLPANPPAAATCHVVRSVCRRAERCAVAIPGQTEKKDNVLNYLNRLSDYLFTLSRKITADCGLPDDCWLPESK